MNEQTAVVIGATGLIGHLVVEYLLKDPSFKKVRILVREKTGIFHAKLEEKIFNFADGEDFANKFGKGDVIFSCVGTTQKKVQGDKSAYRKVDFDIPVHAAKIGIENGFKKFMLVSSVGADAKAKNFYLKPSKKINGNTVNHRNKQLHQTLCDCFGEKIRRGLVCPCRTLS